MNKETLQKQISEMEVKLQEMKDEVAKIDKKCWKLEENEKYYYVDDYSVVDWTYFVKLGEIHKFRYTIGNCFKTETEAEHYKQRLLVLGELQRFADENNDEIDWSEIDLYTICMHDSNLEVNNWNLRPMNEICFTSRKLVEQAIEKFGDRLLKYVFDKEVQ